jgi:hypothetical protein
MDMDDIVSLLLARIERIERLLVLAHKAEHGGDCCPTDHYCLNMMLAEADAAERHEALLKEAEVLNEDDKAKTIAVAEAFATALLYGDWRQEMAAVFAHETQADLLRCMVERVNEMEAAGKAA